MKSDIEIAQEAKLIRIDELAHSAGLSDDEFEPYGRDKAKVSFHKDRKPHGKLILVTATSGMPAGSGKTTTSIALTQGRKSRGGSARTVPWTLLWHEGRRRRRRLLSSASDGVNQPALYR